MKEVKTIVAEYLPGADMAGMQFLSQAAPNGPVNGNRTQTKQTRGAGGRMVVTVSKKVQAAEHTHHHIMRVTLDEGGKAVKLSLSR